MKYYIKTFGCQMNQNDTKRIANYLEQNDHQAASVEEADLIVVNMCSIRQSAVDRVYGLAPKFKQLKKKNPGLKTVLTGCILKKDRRKLEKIFDYVLSKKTLAQWNQFLQQAQWSYYPDPRNEKFEQKYDADYLKISPKYQGGNKAYLPISTGCDNFCSFCVVPYTRGPESSRNPEEILKEAEQLIEKGVKELWLLGQNVNSYQKQTAKPVSRQASSTSHSPQATVSFADLVKKVSEIEGDFWLKYTSSNPKDFNKQSIRQLAKIDKVAPYLNLPLQSGDDEILKKMNRPYSVKEYKEVVNTFRKKFKERGSILSLSTDIIVGFPGETEEQFQNTVKIFKGLNFDMAYIAKYSPRPQTQASEFEDNVSPEEKKRREQTLTNLLEKQSLQFNQELVGKTMKVVKLNSTTGKNKHNKTVKLNKSPTSGFASVKITEASPWHLSGKLKQ